MSGAPTFSHRTEIDPTILPTPLGSAPTYFGSGTGGGASGRAAAAKPNPSADEDRRLTYRERRKQGLSLSDSWLTEDRPIAEINDETEKYSSLEDARMDQTVHRTYRPTGRVTNREVGRRTKSGPNPTGLQHREARNTPGSPANNGGNPLLKRGMSVSEIRDALEGPPVEGLGAKLAAAALDPATRIPGEDPKARLKRQAVAYAHEGLRARKKLEEYHIRRALGQR